MYDTFQAQAHGGQAGLREKKGETPKKL